MSEQARGSGEGRKSIRVRLRVKKTTQENEHSVFTLQKHTSSEHHSVLFNLISFENEW